MRPIVAFLIAVVCCGSVILTSSRAAAVLYTGLHMPWPNGVTRSVTQTPGPYEDCSGGSPPSHCSGIDLWAYDFGFNVGDTVAAAHSGTVLGYQFSYGTGGCDTSLYAKANFIVLNHGDGYSSQYWHLLGGSAQVSPGQFVYDGHPLGSADTSGAACGAHLHFAVEATPTSCNGNVYLDCIGQSQQISFIEGGEPSFGQPITSTGRPRFSALYNGQSPYLHLSQGGLGTFTIQYINKGYDIWNTGINGNQAYLGTWGPIPGQDQPSLLGGAAGCAAPTDWLSCNRIRPTTTQVDPDQIGWFQFQVRGPSTVGTYPLHVRPLIEGIQWMEDVGVFEQVTVP